jgi:micrococcal nuclease
VKPRSIQPLCRWRKLTAVIVSLSLTAVLNLLGCSIAERRTISDGNFHLVERVIDGDTLVVGNGERVRLIGVDTPETKHPNKPVEHFGKEAAAFTRRIVEGRRVRLEFDPANAARAHKDSTQQRRTLAYVFLEDGALLNSEIIKQGYDFAYTRFPFARMEEFRRLEREAKEHRRRLWKAN